MRPVYRPSVWRDPPRHDRRALHDGGQGFVVDPLATLAQFRLKPVDLLGRELGLTNERWGAGFGAGFGRLALPVDTPVGPLGPSTRPMRRAVRSRSLLARSTAHIAAGTRLISLRTRTLTLMAMSVTLTVALISLALALMAVTLSLTLALALALALALTLRSRWIRRHRRTLTGGPISLRRQNRGCVPGATRIRPE
ncbi:MAG: hypothetical protein U0798_15925 [Gemmataceae bacterium]